MDKLPQLCLFIIILLSLSAFFSGSEIALTSATHAHLETLAEDHPFLRVSVAWFQKGRYQALSTILIGNNLVNVAASTTATGLCTALFKENGVACAVAVMSVLIIIWGEVLPKCIAMARGDTVIVFALPIIHGLSKLMAPLIVVMGKIADAASRITGCDLSSQGTRVTKEEIGQVVKIGEESGALEETERQMIDGVISFDQTRVSEIMVPRTQMRMIEAEKTVDEALQFIQEQGDSRVPVYQGTPDNIKGIVLVKDLLSAFADGHAQELVTSVMRKPLFIPETLFIPQLFRTMQDLRMHMAVVVDEYGGVAGLITLEDLLEEIVGEIQDEYDDEERPVITQEKGVYRILGQTSLEELSEALGTDFTSDDVDSIGGLLLSRFESFPEQGNTMMLKGWLFTVTAMGEHRIKEVTAQKR